MLLSLTIYCSLLPVHESTYFAKMEDSPCKSAAISLLAADCPFLSGESYQSTIESDLSCDWTGSIFVDSSAASRHALEH